MQSNLSRHQNLTSCRPAGFPRNCEAVLRSIVPSKLRDNFSELLKRMQDNLHFDHIGLGLYDPDREIVSVFLQAGEHEFPPEIPVVDNSLELVVKHRQAIEVVDADKETEFRDLAQRAQSGGFKSFRVVPLITDCRALGALAVVRRLPGHFSQDDVHYLDHAAELAALVLENALIADLLAREKAQLETLVDVNNALISKLDVHALLREISSCIRRIVRHDYTHLALYEKPSESMRFYVLNAENQPTAMVPEVLVPLSECPAGIVFRQGEARLFKEADLRLIDSDYVHALLRLGVHSVCCFPLTSRGRKLGTLGVLNRCDDLPSEHEMVLLTQIASQVAIAIDNARAYEEIAQFKEKLAKEKLYLEDEIRSQHNFDEVVGNSPALKDVLKQVEIAAPSDATVLVLGETGTGKELIARAVHRLSSRREGNFIKLNCAAIPTGLLESELFGHEKGAFTGAISQKVGRLELADKGTIFLDEIGEIPMELQPKLLRVLQDHEFERLGGIRTIRVNVRLIAATNRDLALAVEQRQFRSDLYYRLNVFPIRLPPLRDRTGDIPILVRYFVQKFARRMGKSIETIPAELIQEFEQWHWPGNVRELENFIERSVILTQGRVFFAPMVELRIASPDRTKKSGSTLEDVERDYILRTLRESGGVIAGVHGAAARLGMKRTTLQSRMQKLGITREEYEA